MAKRLAAVVLLSDHRFEHAQAAYLKANQPVVAGDPAAAADSAGEAVTAASKALGCPGSTLADMAAGGGR